MMTVASGPRRLRHLSPLALALIVGACGASPGPSAPAVPADRASPAPSLSTELAPSVSADAPDVPIFDRGQCCLGQELAAGTYRSPYAWVVGITVDVPPGWRFFREDRPRGGVVALVRGDGNEIGHAVEYVAFFPIPGDEPIDAFVADLRATPLLSAGPVEELTIAGGQATAFDATAQPNPDMPGTDEIAAGAIAFPTIDRIFSPYKWRSETPEARFRFVVVEHDAGGLLVYLEAPSPSFDQLVADAEPIVGSVTLID